MNSLIVPDHVGKPAWRFKEVALAFAALTPALSQREREFVGARGES